MNAALATSFYGWPYCGARRLSYRPGLNGDNLLSTQLGLSQGYPDGNHDCHFWSYHPNLAQFLWADGSGGTRDLRH